MRSSWSAARKPLETCGSARSASEGRSARIMRGQGVGRIMGRSWTTFSRAGRGSDSSPTIARATVVPFNAGRRLRSCSTRSNGSLATAPRRCRGCRGRPARLSGALACSRDPRLTRGHRRASRELVLRGRLSLRRPTLSSASNDQGAEASSLVANARSEELQSGLGATLRLDGGLSTSLRLDAGLPPRADGLSSAVQSSE